MAEQSTYPTTSPMGDADPAPQTIRHRRHLAFGLVGAIFVLLLGAALGAMATVAIPVILSVFVTLAVLPLDRAVAARMPDKVTWLGRVAVMVLLLLILTLFIGGLAFCVTQIAANLADVSQQIEELLPQGDGEGRLAQWIAEARSFVESRGGSITTRFVDTVSSFAQAVASAMGVVLAGLILVLFLTLLALSEARLWEAKLDNLSTGAQGANGSWREVSETLGAALRRFILTRAALGVLTAVIYTLWLLPFGLDLLLVWAILTFLMNFIPNIGSVISGVFPTIYAFLTLDFGTALLIGAGLIVIEQVIGNWVDPKLQGGQVALSPLVILVAVVFWGWLWGIAGAFLGTPMTLAIMIVCQNIAPLRPIALLLSNQRSPEDLDRALS